jgi:hypothetical protein
MTARHRSGFGAGWRAAAVVIGLGLAHGGCGLTQNGVPAVNGPSELAASLKLTISPDLLYADGHSHATVMALLRGPDGRPVGGRTVFFGIADDTGTFADIGTLSNTTEVTDGNGIAQVTYTAVPRTDNTANRIITILARLVTDDASGQIYRSVSLELRAAEGNLFPPNPRNKLPLCNFVIEPAVSPAGFSVGQQILFQSTASDPDGEIVRYQWDFGDGTPQSYDIDVNHVFTAPGGYTVGLTVTDNNGGQAFCGKAITVH